MEKQQIIFLPSTSWKRSKPSLSFLSAVRHCCPAAKSKDSRFCAAQLFHQTPAYLYANVPFSLSLKLNILIKTIHQLLLVNLNLNFFIENRLCGHIVSRVFHSNIVLVNLVGVQTLVTYDLWKNNLTLTLMPENFNFKGLEWSFGFPRCCDM